MKITDIDLDKLSESGNVKVSIATVEDTDEKKARIEMLKKGELHKIWRGTTLFCVSVIGLLAIGSSCLWILLDSSATSDTKKLAETVLMSIVTGVAGLNGN
jgi:hypothetical protein